MPTTDPLTSRHAQAAVTQMQRIAVRRAEVEQVDTGTLTKPLQNGDSLTVTARAAKIPGLWQCAWQRNGTPISRLQAEHAIDQNRAEVPA